MKITVTQPSLPPIDEFFESLRKIWDSKWLTNGGPFHQEFEQRLAEYLGVQHLSLFSNGTLGLITALQAMEIQGEVITTPYSFVATSHSLWWNGMKPVLVDIDPIHFNMNPEMIEAAITPKTQAIMPVHVYGTPCDTSAIQRIAIKHGLKVIYDAAHAFGVNQNNASVLNHGDLSVLSFHATKVFNTIEGGAIISQSAEMKQRIDHLKNFGFADETTVVGPGINAKMNEIQAAYGLLQLNHIEGELKKRKAVFDKYHECLKGIPGITLKVSAADSNENYSYFPILVDENFGVDRDTLYNWLKENEIYARRYFYPLISHFPPYNELESARPERLPNAESIASKVICLPIYANLEMNDITTICALIKSKSK